MCVLRLREAKGCVNQYKLTREKLSDKIPQGHAL